jgi:4-diphosphocytidyl-2-C-methyl-D-erythritol kinase
MSRWLRIAAPAKLNLMLHITGRRADGFHELQTVIEPIDWSDELRLRRRRDGRIVRRIGPRWVPAANDLCVRSAVLLQSYSACGYGAEICLRKRVPSGAGLGGGSADAAAVLIGLNRLWRLGLPARELEQLALHLGTDVPALVRARPLWATALGEKLSDLDLPARHYVVVFPRVDAATADMYQSPLLRRDCQPIEPADWSEQACADNVFEPVLCALAPAVNDALSWLRLKLPNARLTGSGSAVFGTALDRTQALAITRACPPQWQARACRSWRGSR